MADDDSNRADARFNATNEAETGKTYSDLGNKAVLDNMARLKALRLAREAAQPPRSATVKKARAKANKSGAAKKSDEKGPALGDWLASRQNGGFRT
jgi:hypothetical protein